MDESSQRKSVERIGRVFQLIFNKWAESNSFDYRLAAPERVVGRPLDEIRNLRYWLGVGDKGEYLNLVEVVAVFKMIQSQREQVPYAKHLKEVKVSSTVNLAPTNAEMIEVIRQLHVTEPA
jgi:hypothetical protein